MGPVFVHARRCGGCACTVASSISFDSQDIYTIVKMPLAVATTSAMARTTGAHQAVASRSTIRAGVHNNPSRSSPRNHNHPAAPTQRRQAARLVEAVSASSSPEHNAGGGFGSEGPCHDCMGNAPETVARSAVTCATADPIGRRTCMLSALAGALVGLTSRTMPANAEEAPVAVVPEAPTAPPEGGSTPPPAQLEQAPEEGAAPAAADKEPTKEDKSSKGRGRLKELESLKTELAEKEIGVQEKEIEMLKRDQTLAVLQEELELAKKLNSLLKKDRDRAIEEAKLSIGLCAQAGGFMP